MHMTLPLKKEVVKLSQIPCDGKNFPSRIHISVFPPRAAGSLCNNRTFNSFQGQHDLKGQGWVEHISEHQTKQMLPAVLSRSCNMLQYNVHEVLSHPLEYTIKKKEYCIFSKTKRKKSRTFVVYGGGVGGLQFGMTSRKQLLFFWILSKLPPPQFEQLVQLFLKAKNVDLSNIQNDSLSKI